MRYIPIFILFPALICAQETPDSTATTYENRAGTFFAVTRSFFPTGRVLTDEQPLGSDTNGVVNAIIGPVFNNAGQFAQQAANAARIGRIRQQINLASASLQMLTGSDYYDITNRLLIAEFLPPGEDEQPVQSVAYTMRVDGRPIPVTLRRSATGQLVMRQGATSFRVDIVSRNWIRIRRYDGSDTITPEVSAVDLFKEAPNRWISLDLKFILRL